MWFVRVPEGKTAKNRIHFDLWPTSATRDEQVQRAIDLGAVMLDDRHRAVAPGGWCSLTQGQRILYRTQCR